jgi:hypothetical protein
MRARTVFVSYLVFILGLLAFFLVIGLLSR